MSKKKPTKIIETIDFGCYPGRLMYTQGFSHKEVLKELKKAKALEWLEGFKDTKVHYDDDVAGVAIKRVVTDCPKKGDIKELYYIIMPNGCNTKNSNNLVTLAHECLHICQLFLPEILDRTQEWEAEAYFHSYIMDKILKILEPYN